MALSYGHGFTEKHYVFPNLWRLSPTEAWTIDTEELPIFSVEKKNYFQFINFPLFFCFLRPKSKKTGDLYSFYLWLNFDHLKKFMALVSSLKLLLYKPFYELCKAHRNIYYLGSKRWNSDWNIYFPQFVNESQ